MKLWTIGVLLAVAIFAAPHPSIRAQQPPLTRDQVLNLVRNQLGDEAGAKAIQQRGIDFVPAQDFLDALRDAGAKDVFLQALRASGKSEPAPAPSKKPISQIQIVNLLFAKVSSQRVAVLVAERGIDFEPTDDFLHFLEGFHAEGVLAPALQKARVIKPQLDAAALANQTRIQEHTARGLNLGREGKMAQAEQEFQAAVDLDPSKSELHFLLAIAQKAESKSDEAIAHLREGIRLNPRSALPQHHELGLALEQKGDLAGALAEYRESLRVNPDFETARVSIGVVLKRQGDLKGAIAEFRSAIRDNPGNDDAYMNLGLALDSQNDLDGAIAAYREAIRLDPQVGYYHGTLGGALRVKGDLAGALAEYREAVRLAPTDAFAHSSLGETFQTKGDLNAAIAEFREAVRLLPDFENFRNNLALSLEARGDLDGAIAEFREAVRLKPDYDIAHFHLGEALEKKGELGAAFKEYEIAHQHDPQNTRYKESYERLLPNTKN